MSLNVSITKQLEKLVKDKVKTGRYLTSSEVVREGLRLLDERDRMLDEQFASFKRDVRRGVQQVQRGEVALFDAVYYERIIDEERRRRAEQDRV